MPTGENLSFHAPEQKNFTYMKSLGSYYSEENVRIRLAKNRSKVKTPKHLSREARMYINISTYVTTGNREGFEHWTKLNNLKEAARTKHQAEYLLHDSLKKELQNLGVTKIPSSNKIQKRIENLDSEQVATVREKQELQKKQKTLDIIRQNFTALLNASQISNNDINRTVAPPL